LCAAELRKLREMQLKLQSLPPLDAPRPSLRFSE
jgi:hypothetical protein